MVEINLYNQDCMEAMRTMPDNAYDLAIVDPVFGEMVVKGGYMNNSSSSMAKNKKYNNELWKQEKTNCNYFTELKRISNNQIIWGGNYFVKEINENSSCWIVWNKKNGNNHFADCEIAYTSFKTAIRIFDFRWQGMLQEDMKNKQQRIHPTEKPIKLYKWLLHNYAKEGDKILDTHGGSMSIALACHDMKFDLDLYEIDKDYFEAGKKRYENHIKQLNLF